MSRPNKNQPADKLRLVSFIVLAGFSFSICFHAVLTYLLYDYPYNTFLYQPWDRFKDFTILYDISKDLNPYAHFTNYFPFAYLFYYPFTLLPSQNMSLILFLEIFCAFMVWHADYYLKSLKSAFHSGGYIRNILILSFLTYPVLFCLDRANLDAMLFIFIALFLIYFTKKYYNTAAFFLAIAISMKAFPLVYLVLFIKEKKIKPVIYCLLFTVMLTVLALLLFKLSLQDSFTQFLKSGHNFIQNYSIKDGNLTSSISLFSLLKVLLKYVYLSVFGNFSDSNYRDAVTFMLPIYFFVSVAIFILVSAFIVLAENVLWKQVILLTIMLALLPNISGDYRLVFFYIPLLLFITSTTTDSLDFTYTILFGLLFIPKNFFIMPHTSSLAFVCSPNGPCGNTIVVSYSIMSLLNILILLTFASIIIYTGIRQHLQQTAAFKNISLDSV